MPPITTARLILGDTMEGTPPDFLVEVTDVDDAHVLDLDALPAEGEHRFDVVLFEPDLTPPYTVLTGRPVVIGGDAERPRLPTASVGSAELYVVHLFNGIKAGPVVEVFADGIDDRLAIWTPERGVEYDEAEEAPDLDTTAEPTTVVEGFLPDEEVPVGDVDDPLSYVLADDEPAALVDDDLVSLPVGESADVALDAAEDRIVSALNLCPSSGERVFGFAAGTATTCRTCRAEVVLEAFPDGDHPLSGRTPDHVKPIEGTVEVVDEEALAAFLAELPEPNTAPPSGGELCDVGKVVEAIDEALRGSPVELDVLVRNGDGEVIGRIVNAGWGHVFRTSERADRLVDVVALARPDVEALATAGLLSIIGEDR